MLRYLILGLLRHGGPRHGYALMKEYRERTGRPISIGNLYRELQRLHADGLVRATCNPSDADARRAPYEITDAGSREFLAWLSRPGQDGVELREDGCSLRAFLAVEGEREVAERVLDQWSDTLRALLGRLQRARDEAVSLHDGGRRDLRTSPLWLGRALRHVATDLEFVQELRAACGPASPVLEEGSGNGPRYRDRARAAALPPRTRRR